MAIPSTTSARARRKGSLSKPGGSAKISDRPLKGRTKKESEATTAVAGFFDAAINRISDIRNGLQFGFGILTVLAFMVVHMNANTPILPQIFIFSVVPLLIAMQLVAPLKKGHQFVIVIIISVTTLAFLGAGVTLSLRDQTTAYLEKHRDSYAVEDTLNQRYLVAQKSAMPLIKDYSDYRDLILTINRADNSEEMISGFDTLVDFYEDYLSCTRRLQCWPSAELDQKLTDFWYTYRPVIEERRLSFWGPTYATSLQGRAEALQSPHFLSAVRTDPVTGAHVLVSTKEQKVEFFIWLRSFV